MVDAFVLANIEVENIQIPSKKTKGNSMVELKDEGLLISSIKVRGRSYVMIGESNWRPKTRAKNKLRLNMKKRLNPKLDKENINVIADSSSQEDLKEDEDMNFEQINSRREDSLTVKPSLVKKHSCRTTQRFQYQRR